ncbi:YhjD/YihY/BrkB family envelope integrity protein [Propionicimonas sp.]|uniref:YhjD/YihY/BrkB family envelope integrity protein n=1 Tax=Propionicimonas sp. TaxID=1955623 RepID=UPI0017F2232D|nr:YhjD/YihY/BrkB family envelope integrity protein [Propionicimonas sp.]MBU3977300.1 YihY/virulence factor BrkB family protein [Actinomycetota bacterium]MBA3021225.1 hypothetical protein [Propionicimonas sp.]MBU3985810.1 YihY/virulence factor BrkB family protein [Actinomycetota bacterium]MBU4008595.1 YihY/virulence factor BrkB family protein [Actinomycetota bacterium]MBU4066255.1 YihY/virulence factor BrkB family protein [Actinomycetota bacterium]
MQQRWQQFSQHPLVAHLIRAVNRFNVRGGSQFAAAISYFSVLSLVPVLMLAFSGLGLALTVMVPESLQSLEDWLTQNLTSYGELGETLANVVIGALGNWAALGLAGFAIALWTGASWIGNLKRASRALMRTDYDDPGESLPLPLDLLVNFAALVVLFLGVGLSAAATIGATTLGQELGRWLGQSDAPGWAFVVRTVSLLLSLAVGTLLFWGIFRWFTLSPVRSRLLWIGAFVGAVGLTVLLLVASYLIEVFSKNVTASLFGPVIVLMIFLNLFATLILFVASWLATAVAPTPRTVSHTDPPEPVPTERRPGELYVSAEVARKSMGFGLGAGYAIGGATGLGLGAIAAATLAWIRRRD